MIYDYVVNILYKLIDGQKMDENDLGNSPISDRSIETNHYFSFAYSSDF